MMEIDRTWSDFGLALPSGSVCRAAKEGADAGAAESHSAAVHKLRHCGWTDRLVGFSQSLRWRRAGRDISNLQERAVSTLTPGVGVTMGRYFPVLTAACASLPAAATITIIGIIAGTPMLAGAQNYQDLRKPGAPLVLQSIGSFYVGGRTISASAVETGLYGGGPLVVDQMYVQYMIPKRRNKPPVVMIHGATLTGKSYETTPDGRMGWYEYFVRRGYPSYVVDQVDRGRSGFDQGPFNDVRAGLALPTSLPNLHRFSSDSAWVRFRFGSVSGVTFGDTQFPVEATGEFAKQSVPDLLPGLSSSNPNYSALSDLAKYLNGAVLMGHSQAGRFPFETALLNPRGIRALVAIEPAGCKASEYSPKEIAKLAQVPILIVFGDHIDSPQSIGPQWEDDFKDCQMFVARIRSVNGKAKLLHTTDLGIHGNSHMIMQDKNNTIIADLIMKWIDSDTAPAGADGGRAVSPSVSPVLAKAKRSILTDR